MNPEARADVARVIGCMHPNVSICATVSRAAIGFVGFLSAQRFPARRSVSSVFYLRNGFPRGSGTFPTCHVECEARSQITHVF